MNVAYIPVRGGSKSIPLKNIKLINGKPLVYWTVKAACECNHIDKVYVATDSNIIRSTVEEIKNSDEVGLFSKVVIIERSTESATDTASTESAMLEFAENYDFDNIVLIQATSPLLRNVDLYKGFELFEQEDTDSVFSAVRQKRFNWNVDSNGNAIASNYDVYNRPRRQEFEGYYVENGAFYITSKEGLLRTKNRLSGNIKLVEMNEDSFFEIDEPSDWTIIEALMKKREENESEKKSKEIKLFLTDCDGCMTDGGMYYSEKGDEIKKFNTRDGMAFEMLRKKGILTGIITSENVELNRRRAEKLKIDIFVPGCKNKLDTVVELCNEHEISIENVAYIGDDINDIDLIRAVGFGCCPNDAVNEAKKAAKYIAKTKGGCGVIREIAELILN